MNKLHEIMYSVMYSNRRISDLKSKYQPFLRSELIKVIENFFDILVVFGSLIIYAILSYYRANGVFPDIFQQFIETFYSIASYSLYLLVVFFLFRIYKPSVFLKSYLSVMKSIALSLILSNIVLVIFTFINGDQMLFSPMGVIGVMYIQMVIFSIYKYLVHRAVSNLIKIRCMVIGTREQAIELAKEFFQDDDHKKYVTILAFEINKNLPDNLVELITEVDEIYLSPGLSDPNKHFIVQHSIAQASKSVYLVPKTYEISLINSKDDCIDDTLLLHIPVMRLTFEQKFIKRAFDIVVSGFAIIFLLPLFLIISCIIKFQDDGPVLYKQTRYKRNNVPFSVYKFRSMRVNQTKEEINKRASENDTRITKIGKFLRKTRFDELPQLFNVFLGDMSLVGPRPLIKEEIDEAIKDIPEFYFRSNVKPGLTGLAQVMGKYDTQAKEKIRYDLLYVKKSSFWYDLKIIILTVKVLFTKGSVVSDSNTKSIYEILNENHLTYIENLNYIRIDIS